MSKDLNWEHSKDVWLSKYPDNHELVLQHLFLQGVELDDVERVLRPDYETGLHDWSLLPDIQIAIDRILEAIVNDEKVLVFTDYDADGIPGAAIIDTFFKKIAFKNYDIKTPDRNVDGFGLKELHVNQAIKDKVELIITIDCGSASGAAIELANANNINVIVTDHHEVPKLSDAEKPLAMVNPMSPQSKYPYPAICGALVVFKLVQGLIITGKKLDLDEFTGIVEGWDKWLLDLAAIATVGDMMPLLNENRVITQYGLKVLNQTRNYGLKALIEKTKLKSGEIGATDIAFRIAPRINAASRMGQGELALQLLTADDRAVANQIADELEKLNNDRRNTVTQMLKQAHKKLGKPEDFTEVVVAIGDPAWLPGTCGLLASRLVEEYNVSAFVWGRGPGTALKGSCRAYGSDNIYKIMTVTDDSAFDSYGGHVGAGGFVLKTDKAHELTNILTESIEVVSKDVKPTDDKDKDSFSETDAILITTDQISLDVIDGLSQLEPTGNQFPAPLFELEFKNNYADVVVSRFGKNNEHLKLQLTPNLSAIQWRTGFGIKDFPNGHPNKGFQVIGSIEYDSYSRSPRVLISEIIFN